MSVFVVYEYKQFGNNLLKESRVLRVEIDEHLVSMTSMFIYRW